MSKASSAELQSIHPVSRKLTTAVLKLIYDGYLHTVVTGREHVPPEGTAMILAINHTSNLDVFGAGFAMPREDCYFLSKVEATRVPLFGRFLMSIGAIPTNRDKRDDVALRKAMTALRRGKVLGLAPEGTRSRDGALRPFDPGFIWLATRTGAVVVPAAIHGAHALMPPGARVPNRGPMWVRFHPPISYAGEARPSRERLQELAEDVRRCVLTMLADLSAESGVPEPALLAGEGVEAVGTGGAAPAALGSSSEAGE